MSLLLSFDLSTTVCGYSVFDLSSHELIKCSYFNLIGEDLLSRSLLLESFIDDLLRDYPNISIFVIEERLKGFRAGGTNADAMLKTATINHLCQFLMKKRGLEIYSMNVNSARNLTFPNFLKTARAISSKVIKEKELAFEFSLKVLGSDFFPFETVSRGKNKGLVRHISEARDMADSWILGKAFLNKNYAK